MAYFLEQNVVCKGESLQGQAVALPRDAEPCGYATANHRRLCPLLLMQVVSDAYSPAFLCPLSFGDNSSLFVREVQLSFHPFLPTR